MSAIWRRAAQLQVQGVPFAAAMRQARAELDPAYLERQAAAGVTAPHGDAPYEDLRRVPGHAHSYVGADGRTYRYRHGHRLGQTHPLNHPEIIAIAD